VAHPLIDTTRTAFDPGQPIGDFEWSYRQHAPELGPDGQILLFDHSNTRFSPSSAVPRMPDQYRLQ
jgi:hypothetical protein